MVAAEWQVNDNMILVSLPKAHLALLGQTHIRSYLADSRRPIFNLQLYVIVSFIKAHTVQ